MLMDDLPNPLPSHITAKMEIGKRLAAIDPATGRRLNRISAVHLEEKWVEEYELAPGVSDDGTAGVARIAVDANGIAPPVRKHRDFDLVDRHTGATVARIRQDLDTSAATT